MDAKTAQRLIKQAYQNSTSYVDNSLRKDWEANERLFQGRHPSGSKYESDAYKYRSKVMRPKTRATIQSNEADCAFAFFSTNKLLDVSAIDDNDKVQLASARVNQELAQYRLTQSVPWFHVVVGGYQEALKNNEVAAYQYWCYRATKKTRTVQVLNMMGELEDREVEDVEVLEDRPVVELIPPENLRIDPAASWVDPVNSSPYLIHILSMTVADVRQRMKEESEKTGEKKWKKYEDGEISAASASTTDTTRMERHHLREDPETQRKDLADFDVVYVHRNFMRWDGEDWCWYTLGPEKPLTDPVKAKELYWHLRPGERPYVVGTTAVEAFKLHPQSGVCHLTRDLSRELNDLANLRIDNLKQAILGLYGVKRTANVDYEALRSQVPGSGVLMDSETDIWPIEKKDVTASSYQEQSRLDADFGDISGAFSPSLVATNRQMGDSVGGMKLLSAAQTKIADYRILSFAKSFIEPVLGQFVRLLQAYETDETILAIAGQKAKIYQRFGIDKVTDELLRQELTVTVGVGISSTDPIGKVQRLLTGLQALGQVLQIDPMGQILALEEIAPEIFGSLGYQDGARFLRFASTGDDPRIPAMQQQIQQLMEAIKTKQVEEESRNQRMQMLQDKKSQENLMREDMKGRYALEQEAMRGRSSHAQEAMRAQTDILGKMMDTRRRASGE